MTPRGKNITETCVVHTTLISTRKQKKRMNFATVAESSFLGFPSKGKNDEHADEAAKGSL